MESQSSSRRKLWARMIKLFEFFIVCFAIVWADEARGPLIYPDDRIIGGTDAAIEKFPYQVSIGIKGRHVCGGSIIGNYWVLTAGHCAFLHKSSYTIRAGSAHTNFGGSLHSLSSKFPHENYRIDPKGIPLNDIALFRVREPFRLDATRAIVKLYETNGTLNAGDCSVVTGWGTTSPESIVNPRKLQMTTLPIISNEVCAKAYENFTTIDEAQICAGYRFGGKDTCQGDSGGPLVIKNRLAGIVSWGQGCALPRYPGVYTRVSHYREWIDGTMKTHRPSSSTAISRSDSFLTLLTIFYLLRSSIDALS